MKKRVCYVAEIFDISLHNNKKLQINEKTRTESGRFVPKGLKNQKKTFFLGEFIDGQILE